MGGEKVNESRGPGAICIARMGAVTGSPAAAVGTRLGSIEDAAEGGRAAGGADGSMATAVASVFEGNGGVGNDGRAAGVRLGP
jgi:hypothetical protein